MAITRPRFTLIILCHMKTVQNDPLWRSLLNAAKTRQFLHSGGTDLVRETSKRWVMKNENHDKIFHESSQVFEKKCWIIVFSKEFKNAFMKLKQRNGKDIIQVLLKLADGMWPKRERNQSCIATHLQRIVHFYDLVDDLRIIWSVDVRRNASSVIQCIRIFNVISLKANNEHVYHLVEKFFALYTEEYLERCRSTSKNDDGRYN